VNAVRGAGIGPVREIRVDPFGRKAACARREPRQQRARRRREGKTVSALRIDHRLQAEAIPNQVERTTLQVDDRQREHAAQPLDEFDAPVLVRVQDELGVGARAKAITGSLQRVGIAAQS
jgi:hypothetical protein